MNCPACEKEVKVLVDKPDTEWNESIHTINGDGGANATIGFVSPVTTTETYKCSNEKCWVTRIEVDWGQS